MASSSTETNNDSALSIDQLILRLWEDPDREPVASELGVLQSIYGDDALKMWAPNGDPHALRYEVTLGLDVDDDDDIRCNILVSIPQNYPSKAAPQLQLLSRYIGAFGVDHSLFGSVLKTYISSEGVDWAPDTVCVFDGLEWVKERCSEWYSAKKSEKLAGELLREDEKSFAAQEIEEGKNKTISDPHDHWEEPSAPLPATIPEGIEIIEAEPITDRKSAFVGRACRITDPSQVPLILAHLMSDRRIARAAHPVINAWRCQVGTILHQDNDDDGETAAGGRLAHLLQILDVNNILVIVTRYFGGIHLGPDRFKHINQAARNALELGGFLDTVENPKKHNARGRKR